MSQCVTFVMYKAPESSVSRSCIWDAQKEFYNTNGLESWDVVPQYMSSNSFIANQYAQIILSYLLDLYRVSTMQETFQKSFYQQKSKTISKKN